MTTFLLEIRGEGAEFGDVDLQARAVADKLKQIAHEVEAGYGEKHILDFNGNTVGQWAWEDDD